MPTSVQPSPALPARLPAARALKMHRRTLQRKLAKRPNRD